MTDFIKVEDNKSLVRDSKTNAILNTNTQELQQYKRVREQKLLEQNRITELEKKVDLILELLQKFNK